MVCGVDAVYWVAAGIGVRLPMIAASAPRQPIAKKAAAGPAAADDSCGGARAALGCTVVTGLPFHVAISHCHQLRLMTPQCEC